MAPATSWMILRKWRSTAGVHLRQEGNTPGACHEGISDTGELVSRIRSIIVEFNHQVEQAISTRPAVRFGFSKGTPTASGRERRPIRSEVYHRAALFQRLRNRAAHHEPILNGIQIPGSNAVVALGDVWEQSLELLYWMSPDLADLHRDHSAMPNLLQHRPEPSPPASPLPAPAPAARHDGPSF